MEDPEFELRDLHQGRPGVDGLGEGPRDPFRDPSFGRRVWISLASVVLLIALVLIAVAGGPLRSALGSVLARLTPAPTASPIPTATPNATVITSNTATALAQGWPILEQRPLNLPALAAGSACPMAAAKTVNPNLGLALGDGPVYAVGGIPSEMNNVIGYASPSVFGGGGSGWGGQRVLWYIPPPYAGPVLVRGHQIDGPHEMRFQGGIEWLHYNGDLTTSPLLTKLQLLGGSQYGAPAANWFAYTRIQVPGCYAYQVDGLTFSEVIIFQATFS